MIEFVELSESGHNHFAKELFESAFPDEERPPFSKLKDRDAANFHFLVATIDDDEPIGILSYWTFEEFTYIEHFAVAKEFRGQGLGRAVFLNFMAQHSNQVVLEIEMPNTETAERRLEFYGDMGFTRNPQEYWQPNYNGKGLAVPMIVMSKYELDDGEFEDVKDILYKKVYGYTPKN